MRFGGLSPFPVVLGGGASRVEAIVESLNAARGTGYDTSQTSTVYAQTVALAYQIAAAWSANARLALLYSPTRVADMLTRWEAIFAIPAASADSPAQRRSRLSAKFAALGGPVDASLSDACARLLGSWYQGLEYTPLALAHMSDESLWETTGLGAWFSTVAHIVVRVSRPSNVTRNEFARRVGQLGDVLQDVIPAWATWSAATYASNGERGFYLDEPNLDLETFAA